MSENVTFEVQVQQGGQWTIYANFQGHQKDAAIAEAKKQLGEVTAIEAVKVVMEVFDPDTELFNDSVIFKDAKYVRPKKKKVATNLGGNRSPRTAKAAKKAPARQKKPAEKSSVSLGNVVGRLLLVALFSVGLAAIASTAASTFFGDSTVFGVRLVGRAETNLVVGTFIVTFLVAVTGLVIAVMRGVRLKKAKQSRLELWLMAWWMKAAQRAAEKRSQKAAARRAADATARARAATKGPAPAPSPEPIPEDAKETPTEETEEPDAEEAEPVDAGDADGEVTLSPTGEKLKGYMEDFITGSIAGSQADLEEMDTFNKFGASLYLAGACEILATTGKMDPASHAKILAECVQTLGFKKSHAGSFAQRYEEYLMADSRYMQMFQAGRNAINNYLTDEDAGPRLLENALGEWNKPREKEAQSGPVTVMFTDIAGSTAMTQSMGDAGAQQVVRAHNRIVREALSSNAGKEIKHTGDGIMASFDKTSNGVDAAIEMQRGTALHNQANPELPLHLKIGLNTGEPIAEDNDLFGTVVQMSARIVDKASADQIFVSQIVQGICAGKDFQFVNQGGFAMKGFDDDVTLYEVPWNGRAEGDQAVAAEAGAAQAVPEPGAPAPDAAAPETAPQPDPSAPTGPSTPVSGDGNTDGGRENSG